MDMSEHEAAVAQVVAAMAEDLDMPAELLEGAVGLSARALGGVVDLKPVQAAGPTDLLIDEHVQAYIAELKSFTWDATLEYPARMRDEQDDYWSLARALDGKLWRP